ncbi:hypothetical protein BCR34DRAFT_300273 [Clohesyomyces aquaticus]|uniref:BTB domain-containing protein n=1 Tax=Clohesyomyces aquaticus TaxID=1231657 RepID=A0A1Y1ZQF1_9PLEO|nr:hypothetical protein BCR34DRAFT_300273 [Clohesyomyces aquaticus]
MVTVIVSTGEKQQKFLAYHGLLSHYSSYFRAALTKEWNEGRTMIVKVPEDSPEVYTAFFHWMSPASFTPSSPRTEKYPSTSSSYAKSLSSGTCVEFQSCATPQSMCWSKSVFMSGVCPCITVTMCTKMHCHLRHSGGTSLTSVWTVGGAATSTRRLGARLMTSVQRNFFSRSSTLTCNWVLGCYRLQP